MNLSSRTAVTLGPLLKELGSLNTTADTLLVLPCRNEERTIGSILHSLRFSQQPVTRNTFVLCVDCSSSDRTFEIAKALLSGTNGMALCLPNDSIGKGYALSVGLFFAQVLRAHCLVSIDTDILGVDAEQWFRSLRAPLEDAETSLVTPAYRRSRFEASTTNHALFPMLFAATGQFIRQPIGGEIGLSKRSITRSWEEAAPPSVLTYGIDLHLTAAGVKEGVVQIVDLGLKKHRPSFAGIESTFGGAFTAMLFHWRTLKVKCSTSPAYIRGRVSCGISERVPGDYVHRSAALDLLEHTIAEAKRQPDNYVSLFGSGYFEYIRRLSEEPLDPKPWIKSVSRALSYAFGCPSENLLLVAKLIFPLFLARAVGFWEWSQPHTPQHVEDKLHEQALMMRQEMGHLI